MPTVEEFKQVAAARSSILDELDTCVGLLNTIMIPATHGIIYLAENGSEVNQSMVDAFYTNKEPNYQQYKTRFTAAVATFSQIP